MRAFLVVVFAPILQLFLRVCKAQEPVCVQTFCSEATVERLDEGVISGLAWSGEVKRYTTLIGPQIQITRYKLVALVDADRCRESYFPADSFKHLDNVGAAEGEARLQRGEKRENVSTMVSTRSFRPVASCSCTKSTDQNLQPLRATVSHSTIDAIFRGSSTRSRRRSTPHTSRRDDQSPLLALGSKFRADRGNGSMS